MKNIRKITGLWLILILTVSFIKPNAGSAQTSEDRLTATVNFLPDEAVAPDAAIEIRLNRSLPPGEKIAVTLGRTDITALFRSAENRFVYDARIMLLPAGNFYLTVFSVRTNGIWKEISRFALTVKKEAEGEEPAAEEQTAQPVEAENPAATDSKPEKSRFFNFLPTFTIIMKSQPFQSNFPAENRPATRATFNDFNFSGSIRNEAKIGNFSTDANFDFAGSSFKEETLQFGTKGRDAPDIDLAGYLINFEIGKAKLAWGHTSFGNNRHLVNGFSSRGISFQMPLTKRFDISAGILNGTSLVGVGNFSGLGKIRHQVQGATFGIEFFPKRQKAMRLEITAFNGYLQALSGVSERRVIDAERSRGFGLRFLTSDRSERFRLEFGYALSRFFNPQDTTIDPDGNAVALPAALRSAAYLEAGYQVLKNVRLTETKTLNLNFEFRFEIAEPLYRSLGASASADRISQDYALDGSVGDISFQFGHIRSNDNLRNVPSILRSLTRGNRFSIALPLAAFVGKSENASPLLPRFGYSFDRTHQYGDAVPVNGGFEFEPSSIPDQINTNQTFSSSWQFEKFSAEYIYNRTLADNRQPGFAQNDQIGGTHGISFGVNPRQNLSFNVGLNFDTSKNLESAQTNKTKTLTLGASWQPFKGATLNGNFSNTLAGDAANIVNNRNANFDVQFAYNFSVEKSRFRKFGMQAFIRFADTYSRSRDLSFDVNNRTRTKIINAGLTFNFF